MAENQALAGQPDQNNAMEGHIQTWNVMIRVDFELQLAKVVHTAMVTLIQYSGTIRAKTRI